MYSNLGTFLVTLIVTDNNGCMDTVQDTIKIKEIFTIYIPNAFTPNEDYINDLFFPQGISIDPNEYEMAIFDRWGKLVFKSTTWGEGWNGTLENKGDVKNVVMDAYVYRIKIKEIDGPKHEYIGRVSLIP
jgi:gliding motility-associated-like protein